MPDIVYTATIQIMEEVYDSGDTEVCVLSTLPPHKQFQAAIIPLSVATNLQM